MLGVAYYSFEKSILYVTYNMTFIELQYQLFLYVLNKMGYFWMGTVKWV